MERESRYGCLVSFISGPETQFESCLPFRGQDFFAYFRTYAVDSFQFDPGSDLFIVDQSRGGGNTKKYAEAYVIFCVSFCVSALSD